MSGIKLVVFDFDQTLSTFNTLEANAGWGDYAKLSPPPFAITELGQMRRMGMMSERLRGAGGFAMLHFGGPARRDRLLEMLAVLTDRKVKVVMCTEGFVGTAKQCLAELGLLQFFSEFYGKFGNPFGETDYDKEVNAKEPSPDERALLGSLKFPNHQALKPKAEMIRQLKAKNDLTRAEVVLVDDDQRELQGCKDLCHTLWVQDRQGITTQGMEALQEITSESLEAIREDLGLDPMFRDRVAGTKRVDADSLSAHLGAMEDESKDFKAALGNAKETITIAKPSEYKKSFIMSVFQEWDIDGDGFISKQELETVLGKIGITSSMTETMFVEADKNKDGWIEFEEFCNWLYNSEIGSVMLSAAKSSDHKSGAEEECMPEDRAKPICVGDLR